MKISIDTKEDSHEEIKKVINMLNHLIGEMASMQTPESRDMPTPSEGLLNMFNTPTSSGKTSADDATFKVEQEEKKIGRSDDVVPYE